MEKPKVSSLFAPAERAAPDKLLDQVHEFSRESMVRTFLDHIFDMVVVLNRERQIVLANQSLLKFLELQKSDSIIGLRHGEAFHCGHAYEREGGCGTTESCSTCGAVRAILASQEGRFSVEECRIVRVGGVEALDLRVFASPLHLKGEPYTVFTLMDISHEKRRRVLERIFFHDLLNTASGLHGFIELLKESDPEEARRFSDRLDALSSTMIEEITAQRDLSAAENDELKLNLDRVTSMQLLNEVLDLYTNHEAAHGRHLRIAANAVNTEFESDPVLLRRIIGNMAKNALEASTQDETVTLGCDTMDHAIEFWVHNPQCIPRDIQLQIFQRSFSTKGSSRGLGTYSMKLLCERYLGGKVTFTSIPVEGTIFRARIPIASG
ncbi:MAG: HAMP domain-containing histidine kinase [Acidobacteriia bacterium]|nr:HAMP domain-containing histidine kinase [Terriglobia bacterium]